MLHWYCFDPVLLFPPSRVLSSPQPSKTASTELLTTTQRTSQSLKVHTRQGFFDNMSFEKQTFSSKLGAPYKMCLRNKIVIWVTLCVKKQTSNLGYCINLSLVYLGHHIKFWSHIFEKRANNEKEIPYRFLWSTFSVCKLRLWPYFGKHVKKSNLNSMLET